MLTAVLTVVCSSCAGLAPVLIAASNTTANAIHRQQAAKTVPVVLPERPAIEPIVLSDSLSRTFDYLFLEAMVQRQKGNSDAAFDLLRHCLQINPQSAETYFFLAQYYTALRDSVKPMAYIKKAAELNPDNQTYMETLAQLYIRQQRYPEAISVVQGIYQRDKERLDLLEMLFQLYQQTEDYAQAINVLNQLEQIDGKSERLSLAKRSIYLQTDNKKAAVAEMAALARQYPNDQNYKALYGETLMMNGEVKKALKVYDQVLAEEPDNNRVLMSLRTYHLSLNHTDMADSLTERVLMNRNATQQDKIYLLRQEIAASEALDGDSTRVLQLFKKMLSLPQPDVDMAILCATYMNVKKMPKDSIGSVLETVLRLAPDNASARLQLVGYAWEDNDLDRIIRLCQEARQYNPDEMAFYYYQGIAYYKRDSLDAALSAFQNGIGVINEESNTEIVSDFYAVMGDILHQKGKALEAFAAYDSCLQWKDDNVGCLNNYAYYLCEEGAELQKAEQMSYKTIKAEPKNATYLDTYAWILFLEGRYSEAKIYIQQALQNKNEEMDNSVILEHAGDIYAHNEDIQQAVGYWEEALKTKPDDELLSRKVKQKKYFKE